MFTTLILPVIGFILVLVFFQYKSASSKKRNQQKKAVERSLRTIRSLLKIESTPGISCPLALQLVITNRLLTCAKALKEYGTDPIDDIPSIAELSYKQRATQALLSEKKDIEEILLPENKEDRALAKQTLNRYLIFLKKEIQLSDTHPQDTQLAIITVEAAKDYEFIEETLSLGRAAVHNNQLGSARAYFETVIQQFKRKPNLRAQFNVLYQETEACLRKTEALLTSALHPQDGRDDKEEQYGLERMMGTKKTHW
ncbi:hypothetical protein [Alteromonas sp. 14N.309.X.WAT.G.H12]|uniref:hypothetical protein n=1 Tax=Alteromonas sp. 14N.309.X.WAT.G.H12 TaxID=3120824 RepID=UPI002FCF8308